MPRRGVIRLVTSLASYSLARNLTEYKMPLQSNTVLIYSRLLSTLTQDITELGRAMVGAQQAVVLWEGLCDAQWLELRSRWRRI